MRRLPTSPDSNRKSPISATLVACGGEPPSAAKFVPASTSITCGASLIWMATSLVPNWVNTQTSVSATL